MGPAFYIMAILGCGEGDAACQTVAVMQAQYRSVEDCNAATENALLSHTDEAYPVVVAQCQRADSPIAQKIMPGQVDLPAPGSDRPQVIRANYKPARPLRG